MRITIIDKDGSVYLLPGEWREAAEGEWYLDECQRVCQAGEHGSYGKRVDILKKEGVA